jgi:hypothetical protein
MEATATGTRDADELVRIPALQASVGDLFPSVPSLDWEIRQHRHEYVTGGALFEIAGRLLAHPTIFRRIALEIGAKRLAARHGIESHPPAL